MIAVFCGVFEDENSVFRMASLLVLVFGMLNIFDS